MPPETAVRGRGRKAPGLANLERWTAIWDSPTGHRLEFELRGTARGSGEVAVHYRLKEFSGPQPCYVCSPEGILGACLILTLEDAQDPTRRSEVLLGEGMNWYLGIKHHGFLMSVEDEWFRRRFGSCHFCHEPGEFRLGLRFWFYEAGSVREVLDGMRFGIQRFCPDSEGGANGYILYQMWDAERRRQMVEVPLGGPALRVPRRPDPKRLIEWRPDWKATLLEGRDHPSRPAGSVWHAGELYDRPVDLHSIRKRRPPKRRLSFQDSALLPHRVLARYLKPGDPDIDAVLYALTGNQLYSQCVELQHEQRGREIAEPDHEDCLLVGREALSAHYAATLLGRRKYLRPHYELWRRWEYRPPRHETRWPFARAQFQDLRLWFENLHTGDIDISTTNFHTAGATACWLCGHAFGDEELMDIGRRDLMANVIARQERDGFWAYATDRWAGEEGYHLHAMSEMLPLLNFSEFRQNKTFVRAIEKGLDYNLEHFSLGDGSYLGTPWHAPFPEKGNPNRRGYELVFTLYMIDDLAAGIRWLGRDLTDELTRSVQWIYRHFGRTLRKPSKAVRHIHGFVLRPLLLLPLMGFRFQGKNRADARIEYDPSEDRFFRFS